MEEMSLKIDSLEKINTNRQNDLNNLTTFIETLSDGLDSIAQQENVLFYTNKGKERTIVDRKQLRKNLEMFQNSLKNQRQRIALLTDSLRKRGANITKLNSIVNYLNQQLDQKDKMIKMLQADLNKKNVNITQLTEHINTLTENNATLSQQVEEQYQALSVQNDIINEAYIMVGTKKELKDGGFLSGGFLKKTKVNVDNLTKDKFKQVDIRYFKEYIIKSKKPKILSQMPSGSYELKEDGNGGTILLITNPAQFWSVTNYLIIQTN